MQGDFTPGGDKIGAVIDHHGILIEHDAILRGEHLGASAGGFTITLNQPYIALGEEVLEAFERANGGGRVAGARRDDFQPITGDLHVGSGENHVAGADGARFIVGAGHDQIVRLELGALERDLPPDRAADQGG